MAKFIAPLPGASLDDVVSAIVAGHKCQDDRFDALERKMDVDRDATRALVESVRAEAVERDRVDRHAERNFAMSLGAEAVERDRVDRHAERNFAMSLEGRVKKTESTLQTLIDGRKITNQKLATMSGDMSRLLANQALTMQALGTDADKPHRSILTMGRGSLLTWFSLILIAYRGLWAAAPYLWHAAIAANRTLVGH